jgi:PKD repeat protein
MSPLQNSSLYPHQSNLSARQRANITQFRTLMQQAIPAAFSQFQALGYQALTYHAGNNQDVPQPIFTSDDRSYIHAENDTLGGSDQIPFTLAGIPCATFAGNSTYYAPNPPSWSYPYDQPQDTIQLMNTFADGSSQQSQALTLALALPGMLTTWMLHSPGILGEATSDGSPIAAIGDIGRAQVGRSLSLDAKASFDPKKPANGLIYNWNFGDGTSAQGPEVTHTYKAKGTYTLALSVASADGRSRTNKIINVGTQSATYNNPYANYQAGGYPHANPRVQLPTPDDSLTDRVSTASAAKGLITTTTKPSPLSMPLLMTWMFIVGILLLVGVGVLVIRRRRT